jgi:hypothetical protein
VLLGGPAYVSELMNVLLGLGPGQIPGPGEEVHTHPPPLLRVLVLCSFLETLEQLRPGNKGAPDSDAYYRQQAAAYRQGWLGLFCPGEVKPFQDYLAEGEKLLGLLLDAPLAGL